MRRNLMAALLGVIAILLAPGQGRAGSISVTQFFSPAPNVFGSPSWSGYLGNAMTSLQTSPGTGIGNPATDPTAYVAIPNGGTFTPCNIEVTSFNSWGCSANPAAPFNAELGQRLHAGVIITDTGATFDLKDITFAFKSSDGVGNYIDATYCPTGDGGSLCYEGDLSGTTLNGTTRIGLALDGSGVCNVLVNANQSDTTQLCALYYVGVGNAEWPGGPGDPLTGQAALDATTLYIDQNIEFISNQYCVTDSDGATNCGTSTIRNADFVAEPASLALLGAALLGMGAFGRRKRRA